MAEIKQFLPSIVKDHDEEDDEVEADPRYEVIPPCIYPTSVFRSDAGYTVIKQDQTQDYGETIKVLVHPHFLQPLIDRLIAIRDGEDD